MAPAAPYFEAGTPPGDAISALRFAPTPEHATRLLVASWDRNLHMYEVTPPSARSGAENDQDGTAELVHSFPHRAPVLDVCFGATDADAYTAGMDWTVRHVALEGPGDSTPTVVGRHTAPVRCVAFDRERSILISVSWDKTLHFSSPVNHPSQPAFSLTLPAKPHALALSPSKVVVAMTQRLVHIYDLPTLASHFASIPSSAGSPPNDQSVPLSLEPWQMRESPLKFLTRSVACMPSDAGFATSSIEGRVAVEWFEDTAETQARKYAFKCHRQQAAPSADDGGAPTDVVYPVNALAFHPVHTRTFASGGGDGAVVLWDAENKRRLRAYARCAESVAAVAFSCDGKLMAVGTCPGFETGMEDYNGAGRTKVLLRELAESEVKGKSK